jgi:hypothetical protein
LSDKQFLTHYTPGQQKVEGGFRFLKGIPPVVRVLQ